MADDYLFGDGEHFFGVGDHNELLTTEAKQMFSYLLSQSVYRHSMDPLKMARKLNKKQMLHNNDLDNIKMMNEMHVPNFEIWEYLIEILPNNIYIQSVIRTLAECGYRDVAAELYCGYYDIKGRQYSAIKGRSESRYGLRACSRKLKANIHNAPCSNREQYLRDKEDLLMLWMERTSNMRTRQALADLCITVIGAGVDAIAITFSTELYKDDIFNRYQSLISASSNSTLSQIGLLGRWANACAIAGEFAEAEEKLAQARCLTVFVGPSLEQFNSFYTEIYGRLWQYELYPSESLIMSILFWGKIGLKCIEDEQDPYTKAAWKKNFMMRMSLCLLGLGNRTNLIKDAIITEEYVREAGVYILELCKPEITDTIELRRAMILSILKARWLELRDCFIVSSEMYKDAKHKAIKGNFREINFINKHIERVSNRTQQGMYLGRLDSHNIPTSERVSNNLYVILLKETSMEERGIPSGCSHPPDTIRTVGVQWRQDTEKQAQHKQTGVETRNIEKIYPLTLPNYKDKKPTNDSSMTFFKEYFDDIAHELDDDSLHEMRALNFESHDGNDMCDITKCKQILESKSAKVTNYKESTNNTGVKQMLISGRDCDKTEDEVERLSEFQMYEEAASSSREQFAMNYMSANDPSKLSNVNSRNNDFISNESYTTRVQSMEPLTLDNDELYKHEVRFAGEVNIESGNSQTSTFYKYHAMNYENVDDNQACIKHERHTRLEHDDHKSNRREIYISNEDSYLFGEGISSPVGELNAPLTDVPDDDPASFNETKCKEINLKSRALTDFKLKISVDIEKGRDVIIENDNDVTSEGNSNHPRGLFAMNYTSANDHGQLNKYEYGELRKSIESKECDNTTVECVEAQRLDIERDKLTERNVETVWEEIPSPSTELFALNYASVNDMSNLQTTKYKHYLPADDAYVGNINDSGDTDFKQIESDSDTRDLYKQGHGGREIQAEEIYVIGEGIPSWEREPPSGQSTDN